MLFNIIELMAVGLLNLEKLPASQIVNHLIKEACNKRATYIHIEPVTDEVIVKYRVDGNLQQVSTITKKRLDGILENIKTAANINPKIKNLPQNGKYKFKVEDTTLTLNVSTMPTIEGEKVVIRITREDSTVPDLKQLGLWGGSLGSVDKVLQKRHGIIISIGPSRSGRTLSLLSMLSKAKGPDVHIATVENTIETKMDGVTHTEINSKIGLNHDIAIRALRQQDVNVVMIGESQDQSTLVEIFNIARTGKLVLTTMLGLNPAAIIGTLVNMNLSSFEISNLLKLIVNQRLVLKLCENCRQEFEPDKRAQTLISDVFGINMPSKYRYLHELEEDFINEHSNGTKRPSTKLFGSTENRIKRLYQANPDGCSKCNHTGFSGRTAIFEALELNETIQSLILSHASADVISKQAEKAGMIPILTDGLIKAMQGITTVDDVIRACS